MGYRYGVLGSGRQGTASAFDLLVRGESESVSLADADVDRARASAGRVSALAKVRDRASGVGLDVEDEAALVEFLRPLDAAVSAVPYWLNPRIARAALDAGTHLCDLGGSMPIVREQLAMDDEARARGTCLVPDCGEAPGMGNNVMARALEVLQAAGVEPVDLILYDGGIPLDPRPPWNYEVTFNIEGLTNEYDGTTTFVRGGVPVEVECLDSDEYELVEFEPPFGTLEAFPAATSSTTPWTLGARLRSLKSKVVRYPGHQAQWAAFRDAGLFGQDPVRVGDADVVPRQVLHALMEPRIRARAGSRDVVIARAVARGRRGRRNAVEATVDVRVHADSALGFTAMEQATGWHAAIVCHRMASGGIAPGATPVELAVDAAAMMDELRARGFDVREQVRG